MPDSAFFSAPLPLPSAPINADVLGLIADSVICTDVDGRILLINRAGERSFGYSASEVVGRSIEMLLPQRFRAEHARQVQNFGVEGGAVDRLMGRQRKVWGLRKNGEEFPAEATVSRHSVDGRTILTVVNRDITERRELEEQREAIAEELDHRVKNVLSVVSALVSLSAKGAASVDEFERSLLERLRALGATQDFLRRSARGSISLSDLLLAELDHYRSRDGANVVIEAEPMALCAAAIQPLVLVFHELATNSAKYGALSAHGRVTVTSEWLSAGDERLLAIEWRETGGPLVTPPTRQGFGTALIEQVIRGAFRAAISVDYRPEGVVYRMTLPRSKVEQIPTA